MGIEIDDDELVLARVRDHGDIEAFGVLYERHHPAARRFARSLCGNDADADDITADVFTGLLTSLRRGNGPTQLALPYLFASIRHRYWRTAGRRTHDSAIATTYCRTAVCESADVVEGHVVRTALATLPRDVQMLLWRTHVDDECVDAAAERDGISAHHLAVQRHRARQALGTAYLAQHTEPEGGLSDLDPECQAALSDLAAVVRNKVGIRRRRRVERHLATCADCSDARERLEAINTRLRMHPKLPLDLWAAGLTTTIKTQMTGWLSTSVVTLAGSSALAVAALAPSTPLLEPADAVAPRRAAAASPAVHGSGAPATATTASPDTWISFVDRAGDAATNWYRMPAPPPLPSPAEAADTTVPSASVGHTASTSEPEPVTTPPPSEASPDMPAASAPHPTVSAATGDGPGPSSPPAPRPVQAREGDGGRSGANGSVETAPVGPQGTQNNSGSSSETSGRRHTHDTGAGNANGDDAKAAAGDDQADGNGNGPPTEPRNRAGKALAKGHSTDSAAAAGPKEVVGDDQANGNVNANDAAAVDERTGSTRADKHAQGDVTGAGETSSAAVGAADVQEWPTSRSGTGHGALGSLELGRRRSGDLLDAQAGDRPGDDEPLDLIRALEDL